MTSLYATGSETIGSSVRPRNRLVSKAYFEQYILLPPSNMLSQPRAADSAALGCDMLFQTLHHKCTHEGEDGVELRKCGIDKGVGEHVVSLAHTYDTVCANLTLTDG